LLENDISRGLRSERSNEAAGSSAPFALPSLRNILTASTAADI
jgi:hypothetical protein